MKQFRANKSGGLAAICSTSGPALGVRSGEKALQAAAVISTRHGAAVDACAPHRVASLEGSPIPGAREGRFASERMRAGVESRGTNQLGFSRTPSPGHGGFSPISV